MSDRRIYGDPRWRIVRLIALRRDGWRCQIRDRGCLGQATEADHVIEPIRGGAPFDPDNLRAACKPCNAAKGARFGNALRARPEPWPPWL